MFVLSVLCCVVCSFVCMFLLGLVCRVRVVYFCVLCLFGVVLFVCCFCVLLCMLRGVALCVFSVCVCVFDMGVFDVLFKLVVVWFIC